MKSYKANVNGQDYIITLEVVDNAYVEPAAPAAAPVQAAAPAAPAAPKAAAPVSGNGVKITAPMPGTILEVKVSNNQQVKKGDVLFVLEAMKMENEIMAGSDGTVANIQVTKGAGVSTGTVLCELL